VRIGAVILVLLAFVLLSFGFGSGEVSPVVVLRYLFGATELPDREHVEMVLWSLRLPRILGAVLVGACFGLAGALLQTITRNRLAETDLLGINGGAALGVVAGMAYVGAATATEHMLAAFVGALGGTLAVVVVARRGGETSSPLRLILAGLAIASVFQGVLGFILLEDQNHLDRYRFWVLGSLAGVRTSQLAPALAGAVPGWVLAVATVRGCAALNLGDEIAENLGHRPGRTRLLAVLSVALLTGTAVSLSGPVVLLGLVAPYAARHVERDRMGRFLLCSALFGSGVLVVADTLCRTIVRPYEAPASVLVALVGAPLLIHIARSPRPLAALDR